MEFVALSATTPFTHTSFYLPGDPFLWNPCLVFGLSGLCSSQQPQRLGLRTPPSGDVGTLQETRGDGLSSLSMPLLQGSWLQIPFPCILLTNPLGQSSHKSQPSSSGPQELGGGSFFCMLPESEDKPALQPGGSLSSPWLL